MNPKACLILLQSAAAAITAQHLLAVLLPSAPGQQSSLQMSTMSCLAWAAPDISGLQRSLCKGSRAHIWPKQAGSGC